MVGITSYGFYIPKFRIKIDDIAKVWGKNPDEIKKSLNIFEKTVSANDEDSLTMAYESTSRALNKIKINKKEIKVLFFGSETHPYAVNPASTILGEFLGIEGNYLAYDTEFACKAATGALISALSLIKSGYSNSAIVVGSDKAISKPHDSLEYTVASGAVSFILGNKNLALELVDYESFSSDTPDFWRREGIRYPSHGGRFTGKPSYFYHIQRVSEIIFKKNKLKPKDFTFGVFHMPNGKFPLQIAKILGFRSSQINDSFIIPYFGNCYTASSLMGLAAILAKVKENNLIYLCSYGSGAGSDAFIFRATKKINQIKENFQEKLKDKKYIDYPTYLKFINII